MTANQHDNGFVSQFSRRPLPRRSFSLSAFRLGHRLDLYDYSVCHSSFSLAAVVYIPTVILGRVR